MGGGLFFPRRHLAMDPLDERLKEVVNHRNKKRQAMSLPDYARRREARGEVTEDRAVT